MKKKLKLPAIILFISFLISDSVLLGTNSSTVAINFNKYLPIAIAIYILIVASRNRILINTKLLQFTVIMVGIFVLSSIANIGQTSFPSILSGLLKIMLCYLLVDMYEFESYVDAFEKCIYVIAVFSIIVYAISWIQFGLIEKFPVIVNTSGLGLYNLGLSVVPETFFTTFRNYGLFREPGVYQMYLVLALYYQFFYREKASLKKTLIYIISIITTLSTTGVIVMLFVMTAFLLRKTKNSPKAVNKINFRRVTLIALLCIIVLLYFNSGISDRIFFKIIPSDTRVVEVSRRASVVSNIVIWLDHPVFGAGELGVDKMFPVITLKKIGYMAVDNTNTLLFMFACYGTFFGLMFLIGTIGFGGKIGNSIYEKCTFAITIILLYVGENLRTSLLPYIIVLYGAEYLISHSRKSENIRLSSSEVGLKK